MMSEPVMVMAVARYWGCEWARSKEAEWAAERAGVRGRMKDEGTALASALQWALASGLARALRWARARAEGWARARAARWGATRAKAKEQESGARTACNVCKYNLQRR